jgi:uncharacterized membrane protein YtjA (UPF0391 family)
MNIGKSFSFMFEDKQWVSKLGPGALLTFVPILNFAWTGYMVALIRNVMDHAQEPLPNWDDFGKKLTDGLLLALAGLVYALPIIVVFCLPLSFMIVPAILSGNSDFQGIAEAVAGFGTLLFFCLLCVFVVYTFALSVVYPAIMVLYAREGTLAACFKFREVFQLINKNMTPFLTAWGVNIGVSLGVSFVISVAQFVLNFIPCLGQIAAFVLTFGIVVYTSAVFSHLFGQFGAMAYGQNQASS